MALSYTQYVGNGSLTNFPVGFGYLSKAHVTVTINGVVQTIGTDYVWLNDSTIQTLAPVPSGQTIEIRRSTPRDRLLTPYQDGSNLLSSDLSNGDLHLLYLAQEFWDTATMGANEAAAAAAASALAAQAAANSITNLAWINVKAFGATGDGTTNDTTSVQNAANQLTTGGVLYFPPGSYLVDGITLKPKTLVLGAGISTILLARVNSAAIFNMTASALTYGVSIKHMTISGNGKTNVTGILLNGVDAGKRITNIWLEDLFIANCATGVREFYCANTTIKGCFVSACAKGLSLQMCADTDISDTKVQNGTGVGFEILGGVGAFDEGLRMTNCSTNGQAIGLFVSGQDWGVANGCSFTTCSGGAAVLSSARNWKFTGCEFASASANAGLNSDAACGSIQVANCFFANNSFGVVVKGDGWTLHGNLFTGNSNVDIQMDTAVRCSVVGNICRSVSLPQSINETGTTDYNTYSGNNCIGQLVTVGANTLVEARGNLAGPAPGKRYYNLKDFGMLPTASAAVNRAALQLAHDYLHTSGGTLYIPAGSYQIDAPILVSKAVTVQGDGSMAVLDLEGGTHTGTAIVLTSNTQHGFVVNTRSKVEFRGLSFMHSGTPSAGAAIQLTGPTGSLQGNAQARIIDCLFYGVFYGVDLVTGLFMVIDRCVFWNVKSQSVRLANSFNSDQGDNFITNSHFQGQTTVGTYGVYCMSAGLHMTGCKFLGFDIPVVCDIGQLNADGSNLVLTANSFENYSGHGIIVKRATGAFTYRNFLINGNEFLGPGTGGSATGLIVDANGTTFCKGFVIQGNIAYNLNIGFSINGGAGYLIEGNHVSDADAGVFIAASTTATVGVNRFTDTVTTPLMSNSTSATFLLSAPITFAQLPAAAANGSVLYISNGTVTNPVAGGGTGCLAKRLNGVWVGN